MKKNSFLLVMLLLSISMFAQQTSLTIDNQTPGWLSSIINYSDQQTVQNLKVTGYINGTDIQFIRELNKIHNLQGVIDLKDANIVEGGGEFLSYISSSNSRYYFHTETNTLTTRLFSYLKHIQKLILPYSIEKWEYPDYIQNEEAVFNGTEIDTLVYDIKGKSVNGLEGEGGILIKCIIFGEEIENISIGSLFHSSASYNENHCCPDKFSNI